MAQLNITNPIQKKAGVRYMNKTYLKVDMTPMVDLGFLLITFFVFTTEITKPREMLLMMPADGIDSLKIENQKVFTVLLGNNNKVFFYHGNWSDAVQASEIYETNFSVRDGLGNIIREKQHNLEIRFGPGVRKQLILLIKPSETSSYQNFIDALDEVLINDVEKYAVIELTPEEKLYMQKGDKSP